MDNKNSNNRNYNRTNTARNNTNNYYRTSPSSSNNTGRDISSHSNNGAKKRISKSAYIRKLKIKRAIAVFFCLIFMVAGIGTISYYRILSSMNYNNLDETQATDPTITTEGNSSENEDDVMKGITPLSDNELLNDSKVLNIMLFGDDAMDDEGGEFGRSDTMILMSIDTRHEKIKLTSFQRDTYVAIPNHGGNKINSSYSTGGPALAIKTIEANFGVDIDRYAVVGFSSFRNIIDILGGVDLELTQSEIDYINYQRVHRGEQNMYPHLDASEGMVHLCGGQALWYARNRGWDYEWSDFKSSGDDWDRTSRQRILLQVIMESMKDASLTQIISIVKEVGPLVTTNLKKNEITVLATNALRYLKYSFEETSVPMEGEWRYGQTYDGQSIIEVIDWNSTRRLLAEYIYEDMVTSSTQ